MWAIPGINEYLIKRLPFALNIFGIYRSTSWFSRTQV